MKIGIIAQQLLRTKKHGMDMVALELIENLQRIDKKNEYVILVAPGGDRECIKATKNFKIVELKGLMYPFWEQIFMPVKANAMGCDLIHCTANTGPVFSKIPMITTVHDIIYLGGNTKLWRCWASLYQTFGNFYRKIVVPSVIRKSRCVVTVSNAEKKKILASFNIPEKTKVIYNGVGKHFTPETDREVEKSVVLKYKLPSEYFTFLANTAPKKNTKNVLLAFAEFCKTSGGNHKLVLLDFSRKNLLRLLRKIRHIELLDKIHLAGYVQNKDLPAILSLSTAFLYPSLYESFGIPILEAMACGVPVITSNTSSMPETAGGAAVLVDPQKPEEISAAMHTLVSNKGYRDELRKKGMERVRNFSWEKMAKDYLQVYNEVYKSLN